MEILFDTYVRLSAKGKLWTILFTVQFKNEKIDAEPYLTIYCKYNKSSKKVNARVRKEGGYKISKNVVLSLKASHNKNFF